MYKNDFNPIKEIRESKSVKNVLVYFLTFIVFQSSFSNNYNSGNFSPVGIPQQTYPWNPINFNNWDSSNNTEVKSEVERGNTPIALNNSEEESRNLVFQSDMKMGVIGKNKAFPNDNPTDNFFKLQLPKTISENQKVILKYDVFGAHESGVALSINGEHAIGGYFIKENNQWLSHQETLSGKVLKEGENILFFSSPKGSNLVYKIKNLSIVISDEGQNNQKDLLVINQPKTTLVKDGNVFIKGYLNHSEGQQLKVFTSDLQSLRVENGMFEGVVKLNSSQKKANKVKMIVTSNNKVIGQVDYELGVLEKADSFLLPETFSTIKNEDFLPNIKKEIVLNSVKLAIPDSALTEKKNISIEELRYVDKTPMNVGLTNVTPYENSYRFLPDGTQFEKEIEITLPFDSTAIPRGKTIKDVRTYYFDLFKKTWVALPLVSVNKKEQTITSYTTHFTDYINGVIMTPESPESGAFLPTAMSDIKAANPAAGLNLISPPEANQKGSAAISYPIVIPSGRKGMQPQLSLNYSNDGGNGWLGLGWNLATPAITIDSRWGSPVFNTEKETELYSLNGEMLMYPKNYLPHRHKDTIIGGQPIYSTELQDRTANTTGSGKIFTPRKQGSFAKIERIGNSPTNYFWKVTQTDGTIYWYGGYNTTVVDNSVIRQLTATTGNIVHWGLYKVEDVYGNSMTYDYLNNRTTTFSSGNTNLNNGVIFNVKNIYYTGSKSANTIGNYKVSFENQMVSNVPVIKSDPSFNARLGVKQIDPYLLKFIRISHNTNANSPNSGWKQIKYYQLVYKQSNPQQPTEGLAGGRFGKNLLEKVQEYYGEGVGTFSNEHKFDYYDNFKERGALFGDFQAINVPDLNSKSFIDLADFLNTSKIETIQSKGKSYSVRPSVGLGSKIKPQSPKHIFTIGAPFGESFSSGKGIYSMVDMDGDGLDDIVYRADDGGIKYSKHIVVDGIHSFGIIHTLNSVNSYFESSSKTTTMFLESWDFMLLDFYAGTKRFKTKSTTNVYLEDCNGDGNVDLVNDGVVAFNIPNTNGDLVYESSSKNTENLLIVASPKEITPATEPEPEPEVKDDYDVVRMWVAPKDGSIIITDNLQLLNPISGSSAHYSIETSNSLINSGIPFRLYDIELNSTQSSVAINISTNNGNNPPLGSGNNTALVVKKGQKIYFRKINNIAHPDEIIKSNPVVNYTDSFLNLDEQTLLAADNSYSGNFLLSSDKEVEMQYSGNNNSVNITWTPLLVSSQSDNVEFKIKRIFVPDGINSNQEVVIFKKSVAYGGITTISTADNEISGVNLASYTLPVSSVPGKYYLKFEVTSPSNVRWKELDWKPIIVYTADASQVPQGIPNPSTIYPVAKYSIFRSNFIRKLITVAGWNVPSTSKSFRAYPNTTIETSGILTANDNGRFWFITKKGNLLCGKYEVIITGGVISVSPSITATPIPPELFTGNLVSNVSNIYYSAGYYVDGPQNQAVFEKFKQAVGALKTAYISYDTTLPFNSTSNLFLEVDSFYNPYPYLGSMLRDWGQFFYNDKFDSTATIPSDGISKLINTTFVDNPAANAAELASYISNPEVCEDNNMSEEEQAQCLMNQFTNSSGVNIPADGTITTGNVEGIVNGLEDHFGNINILMPLYIPGTLRAIPRESSIHIEKWIGLFDTQYSTKDELKAGGFGGSFFDIVLDEIPEQPNVFQADLSTGMFGVSKEHRSAARSYSAGWGNFSVGSSSLSDYSKTIQDFQDVNGDRYPDIITSDYFQKTNMTGGHNPSSPHAIGSVLSSNSTIAYLSANLGFPISGQKLNLKDVIGIGEPKFGEFESTLGVGVNVNVAGEDRQIHFYTDLNGDGLPENITENGSYTYALNLGNSFQSDPNNTFLYLQGPMNKPAAFEPSFFIGNSFEDYIDSTNDGTFGFSLNAGTSSTTGTSKRLLQDVNGDGLVDLLLLDDNNQTMVYYNIGNGFSSEGVSLEFETSPVNMYSNSYNKNYGIFGSANWFSNIFLFFGLSLKVGVVVSGGASVSLNGESKTLRDFDGDGYLDYVERNVNNLKVAYSKIGKTNMLKSVTNPLGGVFTIDYDVIGRTYDNPNAKWVMTNVVVDDKYSFENDGNDIMKNSFIYENARYDRREREFYGFETVKSRAISLDEDNQEMDPAIYRTQVTKYHNRSYFLNGLVKESFVCKGDDETKIFSKTKNVYFLKSLLSNGSKINLSSNLPETFDVGGKEGRKQGIVLLSKTISEIYELGSTPLVSQTELQYDDKGRVVNYVDYGNFANPDDDNHSEIDYHLDSALIQANIISIPKEIRVYDNNGLKRKRTTQNISLATGAIGTVKALVSGSVYAQTDMTYDGYGNMLIVTYPENLNHQRAKYTYVYDTEQNKNVNTITDVFGSVSTFEYYPFFGQLRKQTDITGASTEYTYDVLERLLTVKGPNEMATGKPYTLKFAYVNKYADAAANGISSSCLGEVDFVPFAITKHYDVQNPANDIETVTFVDGLGRVIQTKKDFLMNVGTPTAPNYEEKMSYSGMSTFDCFGRVIKQYHPYFEEKNCAGSYKVAVGFNPPSTSVTYDEIDRVITSLDEEENVSAVSFSLDQDFTGNMTNKTRTQVDQNESQQIISEVFKDAKGLVTETRNQGTEGDISTKFYYNSIGELLSYSDALGMSTTYQYDQLGRKIQIMHPDKGLTNMNYDPAGNLFSAENANLIVQGKKIEYTYDYNRLIEVKYPDNPDITPNIANVTYTYGTSDAQNGRVISQTDATGTQEFGYGLMGEVVENTRVIKMFGMPDRTFSTRFTYDSWNRLQTMVYPDGEQVNYKYDLGGNLKQVTSTINGTTKNYVSQMDYDHYEQKTYMKYGNNTENSYTYSYSTRRLENLKAKASDGGAMFDNNYAYDKVGNVTAIDNIGGQVFNYLGGTYSNNFTYDKLNRLTDASGSFSGMELLFNGTNEREESYTLTMVYNDVHQIVKKTQTQNSNAILSYNNNTLDFDYSLFGDSHKVETVMDQVTGLTTQFTYDANGNLTRKTENSGIENNYIWDEENRLRAAYYEQMMQYNLYDAAGERIIKMNGEQSSLFENGSPSDSTTLTMNQFTVYPSANLTYNEELQYTKHYYIGSQRIVSRIGEENFNTFTLTESVLKATGVVKDELGEAQRKDLNRIARKAGAGIVKLGEAKEDTASSKTGGDSEEEEPSDSVLPPTTLPIYYFHPDHLGSSSFITDNDGNPAEFFLNLPFGETFVEQRSNTTMLNNPYKFTGKELDENTGLYYYGARFYDPKLSLWLSVDPLAEKMPFASPYAYCLNNPLNLTDPDGREPIKPQAGTAQGFVRFLNNTRSRMGTLTGTNAHNAMMRLGKTEMNWSHMRPEPMTTNPFNTSSDKYIYTTTGGWLDMSHFMFYAGRAYDYKQQKEAANNAINEMSKDPQAMQGITAQLTKDANMDPVGEAVQDGYRQEMTDRVVAGHSAYSYEDLPSDKWGADFGANYFNPNSEMSLGEQLQNYLNVMGATKPQNAPNYTKLPTTDANLSKPTRTNHTTYPVYVKSNK